MIYCLSIFILGLCVVYTTVCNVRMNRLIIKHLEEMENMHKIIFPFMLITDVNKELDTVRKRAREGKEITIKGPSIE